MYLNEMFLSKKKFPKKIKKRSLINLTDKIEQTIILFPWCVGTNFVIIWHPRLLEHINRNLNFIHVNKTIALAN